MINQSLGLQKSHDSDSIIVSFRTIAMPLSDAKRRLLQKYLQGDTAERGSVHGITRRPEGEPAPLSFSQEQLFLRETGNPRVPPLYNECVTLQMSGPLDTNVLGTSLAEIISRHEIWRTSYDTIAGKPIQVVHPAPDNTSLHVTDLRNSSRERQDAEIQAIIGELVRQRFDLKQGPLIRLKLIRTAEFEYRLFVVAHLSVVDGVSVYQVFPSELAALYTAHHMRRPLPLPNLNIQFGDFAYWQRNRLEREELNRQATYWRSQLAAPLPLLNWPTDRSHLRRQTFRGAIRPFVLPKGISDALRQLSVAQGVTLFTTLLAAFTALLHLYTEQNDLIVGTLSPAGRNRSEATGLLGHFLNPVALRFDLQSNPTFRDLLQQAQKLILEAISNDDLPLEVLSTEFAPETDRFPFSVAVSLQPPMPRMELNWSVTSMDVESGGAPWDFYIAFIDRPAGIMGRLQYNPDLFGSETVVCVQQHLERLLQQVIANPVVRFSALKAFHAYSSRAVGTTAADRHIVSSGGRLAQ